MPTVDWFSQAVFTWVTQNSTAFLPEALNLYKALSVLYVAWFGIVFSFDALAQHRAATGASALKTLMKLVLVGFSLKYYVVPTPVLGGLSVHQLLPEFGRYLATMLNTSSLTACVAQLDKLVGAQAPPTWHSPWMQIACYGLLTLLVWCLQGLMFLLTIVGYVFMAVGIVFGPLLLVCALVPVSWVESLTPGWFRYMLNWSMFQVAAAAMVSVWSSMMLFVLNALFHGTYTGIELVVALKLVIVLIMAFWYCALRVERMGHSLFGGVSGAEGFAQHLKGKVV